MDKQYTINYKVPSKRNPPISCFREFANQMLGRNMDEYSSDWDWSGDFHGFETDRYRNVPYNLMKLVESKFSNYPWIQFKITETDY
jgi:hypothetical protein